MTQRQRKETLNPTEALYHGRGCFIVVPFHLINAEYTTTRQEHWEATLLYLCGHLVARYSPALAGHHGNESSMAAFPLARPFSIRKIRKMPRRRAYDPPGA